MGVSPAATDAGMVSHFIRHSGALWLPPLNNQRDVSPRIRAQRNTGRYFLLSPSASKCQTTLYAHTSPLTSAGNKFRCRIAAAPNLQCKSRRRCAPPWMCIFYILIELLSPPKVRTRTKEECEPTLTCNIKMHAMVCVLKTIVSNLFACDRSRDQG
jgi:hypothetical protein